MKAFSSLLAVMIGLFLVLLGGGCIIFWLGIASGTRGYSFNGAAMWLVMVVICGGIAFAGYKMIRSGSTGEPDKMTEAEAARHLDRVTARHLRSLEKEGVAKRTEVAGPPPSPTPEPSPRHGKPAFGKRDPDA
jgi:hypothetical protein